MPLKISLQSFSYKKTGIPEDKTGNGGGFIFDCRFIYNPGRKEEFKNLSGLDIEVIEFLEGQEKMQEFLINVYDIIDPAIEVYLQRDFTNLMICFGCTGGQHRSVYAIEKTKKHILERFTNVIIDVRHNLLEKGFHIE